MSFIQCQRLHEQLSKQADSAYEISDYGEAGRGCIFDIAHMQAREWLEEEGFSDWNSRIWTEGSVILDDSELRGEIPTMREEKLAGAIKRCGANVTDIHSFGRRGRGTILEEDPPAESSLWDLAHVHFRGVPETRRCLVRELLRHP